MEVSKEKIILGCTFRLCGDHIQRKVTDNLWVDVDFYDFSYYAGQEIKANFNVEGEIR